MIIELEIKSFLFKLLSKVDTSRKKIIFKKGWIIRIIDKKDNEGFGEISPLSNNDCNLCKKQIDILPKQISNTSLKEMIKNFHPSVQSGINCALAEIEGVLKFKKIYNFEEISQTVILINTESIFKDLDFILKKNCATKKQLTIKWKVAIKDNKTEEKILEELLSRIPNNVRFRLDANGSWDRKCAQRWADILINNNNLDWLEQPLHEDDMEGLKILEKKIPVALDESLIKYPNLCNTWKGWQIRRPSQEKNPIDLLNALEKKKRFISISSSFETGIGRRLLYHFSNIQLLGPTPKVPGLALKQMPKTILFKNNPREIWDNL